MDRDGTVYEGRKTGSLQSPSSKLYSHPLPHEQSLQSLAKQLQCQATMNVSLRLSKKVKKERLPISELRIKYKVACMCFSAISGSGPGLPL